MNISYVWGRQADDRYVNQHNTYPVAVTPIEIIASRSYGLGVHDGGAVELELRGKDLDGEAGVIGGSAWKEGWMGGLG